MKNCIVLSGQYRTFDKTWKNIRNFIDLNLLDVYCHLWYENDEQVQNIKERLEPKKLLVEKYEDYHSQFETMENHIRSANPKGPNQDRLSGNASMNFSRKQAYKLIDKEYNNIVYCRYDIQFHEIFRLGEIESVVTPLEESYNIISDIFAVIPSEYAKQYFLYDNYVNLHTTQFESEFENWLRYTKQYGDENVRIHMYERYCPHMMLLRNLFSHKVPLQQVDLPLQIQR